MPKLIEGINYQIYDNFLHNDDYNKIQSEMLSTRFPWYYNKTITHKDESLVKEDYLNNFLFWHMFYTNGHQNSDKFNLLTPLLNRINPFSIFRIKANLYPRTENIIQHNWHIDFERIKQKTAIYYINDNNGKTIFKDGLVVDSIKNRLIVFDTDLYHASTTCTDEQVRCNINLNYMPSP
jgi:hypothetical protein